MAQCRSHLKVKESLRVKNTIYANKDDSGCDTCQEESLIDSNLLEVDGDTDPADPSLKSPRKQRAPSSITLRSSHRGRPEQALPDVGKTGSSPTTHSNMKTKQVKDESDKSIDEDTIIEPKTRARKKASDIIEEEKNKPGQDEPKTSKDLKKPVAKPKAVVKKRPLGIRKALRSKKTVVSKDKIKAVIRQTVTRGRKAAVKPASGNSQEKETVPLIPITEIKKEPVEEATPNSRSSSPKTAGRRQRLTSDMVMMKSVLADSPSSLVLGPRTSPYSMRSERSNSPLLSEGKNLRSGKPRKVKSNLLNEVVMKEQKKRRRLLSDSKADATEASEDCKKSKRGRSCSRDGSEISKCSDITESDISLSEPINDADGKELNKKLDKSKTDLDIDIENNVQISTTEKVPSLTVDSNIAETKIDAEPSCVDIEKNKKKLSLKRSTSLDSDNNNSNRLKLENLNSSDIEQKILMKTENNTLFEARSSILTSMSKTFNSKEMSKNIRKARRGRKAAATPRPAPSAPKSSAPVVASDSTEDKQETLETLSKEIDDLINNLDQNIDRDHEMATATNPVENILEETQTKTVSKFYGISKPLGDNNSIITPETPVKDKDSISSVTNENTPSKNDDSENIRLHYEEDSVEKSTDTKHTEITYKKVNPVASIDKLMDRLKEFEEFDKRRQRQESESKSSDNKSVMVSNDVVLIPKSGAEIKPLKDIQSVRSPERPFEKENVLSCFENNSAISIVKRDQVRKSVDIDFTNSVTLIKRNSISARKESTSSNHSKESDAISIFEKSLGKDVTLTEIRKSVDKSAPAAQIDKHQLATVQPNNASQNLGGVVLDSNQISITPRVVNDPKISNNEVKIITKRKSRESISRKSSESANESEEKMATLEKIKSPVHQMKSPPLPLPTAPVAAKSEASQPIETEALPPPIEELKALPEDTSLTTEISKVEGTPITEAQKPEPVVTKLVDPAPIVEAKIDDKSPSPAITQEDKSLKQSPEKMAVDEKPDDAKVEETKQVPSEENKIKATMEKTPPVEPAKPVRSTSRNSKSARNSIECQAGPSNVLQETPESQKRKENVLRTLGLLTHKAAKEAKIEKLKEKERIYKSKAAKSASGASVVHTGSLKAVIKINRNSGDKDKKRYRSSLKMTFQKSKNRSGKLAPDGGDAADDDDTYYTIERREGGAGAASDGGHRKSHYSNRLNNHETEAVPEPSEPKETLNLVIPEKASSFSIHPGRLCQDQCFYCGGKFGLFDTPCHIAQMKSAERQKKVLDNEEKLTSDSCLCDACFRHVDRRANCPSYRKRPLVKQPTDTLMMTSALDVSQPEKPPSPTEEESEEEPTPGEAGRRATCHTEACAAPADHSIRRKWLIKMRSSVNKVLKLECDYPGLHTIPLCAEHHRALAPLMACRLCRRRITKHHNVHFIHHGYLELNPLLKEAGIPVQFTERPLLCKVCRFYCTLLQRSGHDDNQAKGYRRKLLQIHNVAVPPEIQNEPMDAIMQDESIANKQKKKQRIKSKQRKSSDPDKTGDSESSERTTPHDEGSSPEKVKDEQRTAQPLEEDIESLISSNKILVPGAKPPSEPNAQSDGSESETLDMDMPLLPLDKQTELQYLLQKQNNPAQFLQKTQVLNKTANLTQKQRDIMKLQAMSGVHKPGQQQRINDKNAKRIHKLGQIVAHKDKTVRKDDLEIFDPDKCKDGGIPVLKNISLNDECTIETIPNKKPADINTLKNKWQMSESFTQVKKNLSELSKKLSTGEAKEQKKSDMKYSNPVRRLETNPSISVRELFPGEEEMNLQCNIEFNNVKGVTPEGWEKCSSVIQYDADTRRLWHELQRPYGNQSSFLRHLLLLEKYFRSGDLVLAHGAAPHAAMYSDSVQARLRAYDNIPSEPRRDAPVSLIEYRKKPSVNGKSLLKSNQDSDKDPKKSMPPPPGVLPKPKSKSSEKSKSKALPPELIAINTPNAQGRKAIQNVLHNIQQLVKGVSASDPTEVAAAPLPPPMPPAPVPITPVPVKEAPRDKKEGPKADTPKKQKTSSKPWRPTLMPITAENLAKIAREPTQVAVDGRALPSLVQVMSSGTRYHITLQDYNKMCVMRREKLQQLQDGRRDNEPVVTEIQPSTLLGNGGTLVQNIPQDDKTPDKADPEIIVQPIGSNAANILKNVGLKNITIAPIPPKTATVTSQTAPAPFVTSPSLLVTSTPVKLPQLGPAVSVTSETVPAVSPVVAASHMVLPKIPKSLTVIPQTVAAPEPRP
ncbi:uncharacterized protein LOC114363862 isoform X1 [Ostrinia furnacalis]|uniref:uncharacterized protein LOC114363862 isoform X1 n=1 Tax=Ostrinia furnacalis TaxID=93504 RepID=UPI001038AE17|nr:uncharacterized protein LOC114363862 isoform X1 [Ostrinia furnacalis]XP_028175520.1 uncharacterized protein LOC114363862 isoform X1 [Ostrinia furnacalis]XP_028175521.1 uncharacterized protein LOC114363862 isoform X1 [Ostrinia furnacalis]XP_028175522.1 uncharacterized protein LOC114363862 isoform X1 [Ostrinia furnacalis]XP_028175523.1 uncharacterized protein LOC114363862 isoform X1 [Ostrinia furnacalis]XP_028175524.1 uncharacterized protein LOC114363862 isoform X1 [Ostrinia furnacalis]